ncbi:UNVERIFIED_CONTAM: hypothetical protein NCL1_01195 [Trichonephila clavipes]
MCASTSPHARTTGSRHVPRSASHRAGIQHGGGQAVRHHDRGLGHRRHGHGRVHRRPAGLAGAQLRHPLAVFRPPAPAAHQPGDLRLRRLGTHGHLALRGAAHLPDAAVHAPAGGLHLLGLAAGHRAGADHAAAGPDLDQGIRRAGMADRHPHRHRLGRLRGGVLRHHRAAPDLAHLRRELVLRRLHHHHRGAAHRQQRRRAAEPDQVLLGLRRRHGCHDPVVVRPQRRRLPAHRRLPRHDVLLCAHPGRSPGVLVPPVDRAFLGADLGLHVGRRAPPALFRPARLDAVAGHGVLADPDRAELGRHAQRRADAVRRLGQAALRPHHPLPDRGAVVLRHGHLRRPDDVDQDRQRALAQH